VTGNPKVFALGYAYGNADGATEAETSGSGLGSQSWLDLNVGNEADSLSGKADGTATYYIAGNKLTLKLVTDLSETRWGFAVAKVQVVY
jgi:hypothetical protein